MTAFEFLAMAYGFIGIGFAFGYMANTKLFKGESQ